MRRLATTLTLLLAIAPAVLPRSAEAHAFNPLLLEIREVGEGRFDVLWKVSARFQGAQPLLAADVADLQPRLPEACEVVAPPVTRPGPGSLTTRWQVDCGPDGLVGRALGVDGLEATSRDVLARFVAGGSEQTAVFRSPGDELVVRGTRGAASEGGGSDALGTLGVYTALGAEHIALGVDHLLFVLGLVLLVRGRRQLVLTITAFTVAHSLTLALTVLGVVALPSAPVEAVIALSIALVALELVRDDRAQPGASAGSLARRKPWLVAGTFGLLHGFGFAGALAEVGLPAGQIPTALLGFNVGVEIGQLAFVAALLVALSLGRRLAAAERTRRWAATATAYAIGSLAMAWVIERVMGFWEGVG